MRERTRLLARQLAEAALDRWLALHPQVTASRAVARNLMAWEQTYGCRCQGRLAP